MPNDTTEVKRKPTETAAQSATRIKKEYEAEQAKAKEDAKAKRAAEQADAKAKRDAETAEKKAAKAAETAAKAEQRAAEKAAKDAAKEAAKMPTQNGVRRPKPGGKCAAAWDIFDSISAKNSAPASIGEAMPLAKAQGLNEANVRAEYAAWRKFHGVKGRVADPTKPVKEPKPAKAEAAPAPAADSAEADQPTSGE